MADINFKCKKCDTEFDCETGKIQFGDRLSFEKKITCPRCGVMDIEDLELTEIGQTQVTELFFSEKKIDLRRCR